MAAGFAYDRFWVIVDAKSGRFLSQRSNQKLALVSNGLIIRRIPFHCTFPKTLFLLPHPFHTLPVQAPLFSPAKMMLNAVTPWRPFVNTSKDRCRPAARGSGERLGNAPAGRCPLPVCPWGHLAPAGVPPLPFALPPQPSACVEPPPPVSNHHQAGLGSRRGGLAARISCSFQGWVGTSCRQLFSS